MKKTDWQEKTTRGLKFINLFFKYLVSNLQLFFLPKTTKYDRLQL